jgi:Rrf2 family cysteine metabolism transcriptional repressor
MKLSTKSTYGLRAMVNIALGNEKGAVSVKEISAKENISDVYLEQLLNKLRREALVKSVRGPLGGYILSKDPGMITVRDIVLTLEGNISPVDCTSGRESWKMKCGRNKNCVSRIVWTKLAKSISDCLDSITLKDLCEEARRLK